MDRHNANDLSLTFARFEVVTLHAGTIHQVFNETYAQSSALATIHLVTPPLVAESYLVTVSEDRTGDWVRPNLVEVAPYISWTDD